MLYLIRPKNGVTFNHNKDIIYSITHNNYNNLPSFARDIYPDEEDILLSDIVDLHKKYIATGENEGALHI